MPWLFNHRLGLSFVVSLCFFTVPLSILNTTTSVLEAQHASKRWNHKQIQEDGAGKNCNRNDRGSSTLFLDVSDGAELGLE